MKSKMNSSLTKSISKVREEGNRQWVYPHAHSHKT